MPGLSNLSRFFVVLSDLPFCIFVGLGDSGNLACDLSKASWIHTYRYLGSLSPFLLGIRPTFRIEIVERVSGC